MKKSIIFFASLILFALGSFTSNAQFVNGNIAVLKVGDGVNALASTGNALTLLQYTTAGALVDTIALPTSGSDVICLTGNSSSEGQLSRSTDGTYLCFFGYKVALPNTLALNTSTSAVVNRVVMKINHSETVTTAASTATFFSAGNPRGVVSDGTGFWTVGSNSGVCYMSAADSVVVSVSTTNNRRVSIFNNQLYYTTGSGTLKGLCMVGTGIPITTGQVSTSVIPSAGSPYGFNIDSAGTVIYIADDGASTAGGGIQKYTNTGGVWALAYTLGTGAGSLVGARDILVDRSGPLPIIYATTGESNANRIIQLIDSGATAIATTIATAPALTAFRGISFAPIGGSAPVAPSVATGTTSNITPTSATCAGNVTSDGGMPITERGVCYGLTANPNILGLKVIAPGTTGAYTADLSNLTPGSTYYYRAYAINSIGTSYGLDSIFVAPIGAVAPVVTTGAVTAINTTIATVSGNVTNDGGATISARGICWGTSLNPDTSSTHSTETGTTGVFTSNLTGLTPATLYHVRAYAINSVGLSYGADVTFTTQVAGIPCATIAALRAQVADNSTIYELTGEAFLSCQISNRNQKYIQDATAAIIIDDPTPAHITSTYAVGDGITGIKGKLYSYFSLLEFIPIADPGAPTSSLNTITPLVLSATDILDTNIMKNHQSKLIRLDNVSFTDANGTLKFLNGQKYLVNQNLTTDSLFLCYIYNADYINMNLPSGIGSITGVVNVTFNKYYITARNKNDISLLSGINEADANKIDIYPNPSEGIFNVKLPQGTLAEINVYSMTGEIIYRKTSNEALVRVDLSEQASGIFVMQVRDVKTGNSHNVKLTKK